MIRKYILSAMAMFIAVKAGEILLPDGNMKKYASLCISLVLCASLARPFFSETNFNLPQISDSVTFEDTFKYDVFDEYKKRIEANIFDKYEVSADVSLRDDGSIESIVLSREPSEDALKYIVNELGVEENDIKILQNK